jgi:hypothetical protein
MCTKTIIHTHLANVKARERGLGSDQANCLDVELGSGHANGLISKGLILEWGFRLAL